MDHQGWQARREFPVLDLWARPHFLSASSASFSLYREKAWPEGVIAAGWIDVHHPCGGTIPLQLRIAMPSEYDVASNHALRMDIIRDIRRALRIPAEDRFEADFFDLRHQVTVVTD